MKAKSDVGPNKKTQAFAAMAKRKGRRISQRFNAMDVKNMGTTREIVQSSRRTTTKEEGKNPISLKKWKKLKRRNPRRKK